MLRRSGGRGQDRLRSSTFPDAGLVDIGLEDLKAFVSREALQFQEIIPVFRPRGDGAAALAVSAKVSLKVGVAASFADDVRDRPIRQGALIDPGRAPGGSDSRPIALYGPDAPEGQTFRDPAQPEPGLLRQNRAVPGQVSPLFRSFDD